MAIRLLASKRGIYFTVVSIVIISLLVGFSNFDDNTRIKKRGDMLSKRAISMNNFLEDVENDIERMILISGFRALLSVEKHITDTQGFVSDFEEVFSNIFINGSYNDTTYDLMNDASLTEWGDRIDEEANIINLNFEISPNRVWAE
ncbi:hypothetical protein GOV05_04755, partial [Candidatus Woesearchaeota archaeon]|nr:hypothetical protein [Candidatus Woesearchaeota archaeon]